MWSLRRSSLPPRSNANIDRAPYPSAIAWVPAVQELFVFRAISEASRLRHVVKGYIAALRSMGSVIFAVGDHFLYRTCGRNRAFGSEFPEWFGSLPASAYSVFQIMTLESWSMGIVWPVMDVYPEEAMRKLAVLEKKLAERQ
jgi:voltage-gated sodium channel